METNGNKKILLTEDDAPVRKYISGVLSKAGFGVLEAENGKEACELYVNNGSLINAIVSDLRMPIMGGDKLAEFNYEHRFFPFVVCTAFSDSKLALELLKFGVKDYVLKPIEEKHFISVIKNAINRRHLKTFREDDENPYAGNVGSINIPSRLTELQRANKWIQGKLENVINGYELAKFMNFLGEFLLNAHEHGNLKIEENEKSRLIVDRKLEAEMEFREMSCKAKIQIDLSVLKDEVAVNITDDGYGFNYHKYLNMDEETLLERMEMPNGRGICMATKYFDSIKFCKGGSSVILSKKLN